MLSISPGVDANIHEPHPLPSFCSLFLPQLYFSLSFSALCTCLCFRFCGETETARRFLLHKRSVELITRIATTTWSPLQRILMRKYKLTIPDNQPAFLKKNSCSLDTSFSVFPHTLHSRGGSMCNKKARVRDHILCQHNVSLSNTSSQVYAYVCFVRCVCSWFRFDYLLSYCKQKKKKMRLRFWPQGFLRRYWQLAGSEVQGKQMHLCLQQQGQG